MKCLLISLQSNAYVTGLKYISANLLASGHDARILLLPGYLEKKLSSSIEDFIQNYNPDLVGIGLMSIEFYPAKNLTLLLKNKLHIPVIWGGVHAIISPYECLKYADFVCTGEGERAVVSLLNHLRDKGKDISPEIPNILTKNGAKAKEHLRVPPESDLDSLPFQEYLPDYFYGFHNDKIFNFAENPGLFRRYALYGGTCHMMITTRGCPFNCGYCANAYLSTVYGRKVRERSVENCMEELIEVKKDPYVLYINFEDDCFFTHNKEWMIRFSDSYKKYINLPFIVRVIPTMIDREKIRILREAGLSVVVMGIQSGSDRVNFDVYDRRISFSSVKIAADIILESGAAPFYEMIVDNPYQTEDDERDTIYSMARLKRPYIISLAHLTFFPGAPLSERAVNDKVAEPDAYLYRYLVRIDNTYLNKLLGMTPFIPVNLMRYLNRPQASRRHIHVFLVNSIDFIMKRLIEPVVFLFIMTKALKYNPVWLIRTILGNWRSAFSKLISNYLGKGDMEYDKKLSSARKDMPELFEK